MNIDSDDVYTNYAVIDGKRYDLIEGKVSNASVEEDGEQANSRLSWSMELVFPDGARHLDPAAMKVHEMLVMLEGVRYLGKGGVRSVEIKYIYDKDKPGVLLGMRALAVFAGLGPLVVE